MRGEPIELVPHAHVIYLEQGSLGVGEMVSQSLKNVRILDASGNRRKLERRRVLAAAGGRREADDLASAARDVAGGLDMAQAWKAAAGEVLTTSELAARIDGIGPGEVGEVALHLAQARARTYFDVEDGGTWRPISGERMAEVRQAIEKRRARERQDRDWRDQLDSGAAPADVAASLASHVREKVDPNDRVARFLRSYCRERGVSLGELAVRHGVVADVEEVHLGEVARETPPARDGGAPAMRAVGMGRLSAEAVAVDGRGTVEVDDAFAVEVEGDGSRHACVCIAAPALGIDDQAEAQAMERLVTVYLPGRKYPMLPPKVVSHYSLVAPGAYPSLALRSRIGAGVGFGGEIELLEVRMAANVAIEELAGPGWAGWEPPSDLVGRTLADVREFSREQATANFAERVGRGHLVSVVDGEPEVIPRRRLAVADDMVAAMMVRYNHAAAGFLQERGVPFLGRKEGRLIVVREGDRKSYGWFSSPLRRIVDLCNQRQLLAAVLGEPAPYGPKELRAVAKSFDRKHNWAQNNQRKLEVYWSLRSLEGKSGGPERGVVCEGGDRVALDDFPVIVSVPGGQAAQGDRVDVRVKEIDLYALEATGTLA